jgi:hypothetical protein
VPEVGDLVQRRPGGRRKMVLRIHHANLRG